MYFRLLILLAILHISFSDHPKLIIELFRHGARAPLSETDPYWAGRKGQLTKIGQAQHLVLGASLIHDYPHLKEVLDDPSRMFLQSTQMNRTIESLKFHLWGMYHSDNITLDDLDIYDYMFYHKFQQHKAFDHFQANNRSEVMEFTPTRVHVTPLQDEHELLTIEEFTCPNMEQLLEKEAAEELDFIMSMIAHRIKFHSNNTLSPQEIYDMYDLYYANLYEGKHMGDKFVDSHLWRYLKHGAEYFVAHQRWGSEFLRKLYGMPLFEKILNLMEKSHEGDLPYDLVLLSAHDVTVFNLLSALNIAHPKCLISKMKGELVSQHCSYPNFASQLLIELWERDGQPKIRILYEKNVVNLCGSKDGECDLSHIKDIFVKNFASLTLEEIFKHCGKPVCKSNSEDLTEGSPCKQAQLDWH